MELVATADRCVLIVSADPGLRSRLTVSLTAMRWQVLEASGGAEAMGVLEQRLAGTVVLDHWLPDLEAGEFARSLCLLYPALQIVGVDGTVLSRGPQPPRRNELMQALREAQASVPAAASTPAITLRGPAPAATSTSAVPQAVTEPPIEGLVGSSEPIRELARLVRLVAPRSSSVLIEGETGSGKEVVAQAIHRLSARSRKSLIVLNCAAIPEALLEAELFGHARGAFTGAVISRTGRMEAAHGGTLFLDEIGEMPLALQAKMLRCLECGELQRLGENESVRVDVRVIAATHRHLEESAAAGTFRLDLFHRLAVFPLEVPPLRERKQDIPELAEHFLARLGQTAPRKRLSAAAEEKLLHHDWPGNVRELAHVLERATILAGDSPIIHPEQVRLRTGRRTGASMRGTAT